jgi:hypothetical protein
MRVLAAICFAFLSSFPAYAQTAAERAACEDDYKKFCAGVLPGDNRIIECLAGHLQSLSAECKKVVESNLPK